MQPTLPKQKSVIEVSKDNSGYKHLIQNSMPYSVMDKLEAKGIMTEAKDLDPCQTEVVGTVMYEGNDIKEVNLQ